MAILETRAFSRSPGHHNRRMPKQRNSPAQPGSRWRFHTKGPRYPDISTRSTILASRVPHLSSSADLTRVLRSFSYFGAAGAIRRGYNCLTFDGPGQGAPIREQKLPFRYDWEAVVTPAVDYVLTRPDVDGDNLRSMGMSLGGYLAARAVAFEHRFRAAVFFDGVYDFMRPSGPAAERGYRRSGLGRHGYVRGDHPQRHAEQYGPALAYAQGVWSFGASSIADFITKTKRTDDGWHRWTDSVPLPGSGG